MHWVRLRRLCLKRINPRYIPRATRTLPQGAVPSLESASPLLYLAYDLEGNVQLLQRVILQSIRWEEKLWLVEMSDNLNVIWPAECAEREVDIH